MSQDRSLVLFAALGCAVFAGLSMIGIIGASVLIFARTSNNAPPTLDGPITGYTPPPAVANEPTVILIEHLTITATVNSFSGPTNVTAGSTCNFDVEHRIFSNNTAQCHVDVVCGNNVHLYGSPSTGYFRCEFARSPARVVGQDLETTVTDTDGAFVIDTDRRVLEVRDDAQGIIGAFDLRATITSAL